MLLLSSAAITRWFTVKNQATYEIILFHYTCHFHLLCRPRLQMHKILPSTCSMKYLEELEEESQPDLAVLQLEIHRPNEKKKKKEKSIMVFTIICRISVPLDF